MKRNAGKSINEMVLSPKENKGSMDQNPSSFRQKSSRKTVAPLKSLYICMEFAEGGDMQTLINKQKQNRAYFSEKEIW